IQALAFSPKEKNILASAADRTIRLWNVATEKELHRLEGHQKGVYSVAFSPDGKVLASAGIDGVIRLWNVDTGKPIREIHRNRVNRAILSRWQKPVLVRRGSSHLRVGPLPKRS